MVRINLVPRAERPRTTTDFGLLAMIGLLIVVFFGIGFGYYLFQGVLDDRERELSDLKQETAALQAQVAALEQYELLQAQRQDLQAIVQGVYASRTPVAEILDAISLVIPENVWFQSLALSTSDPAFGELAGASGGGSSRDNRLRIEGQTYAFEDVARAVVRLQLIPALRDVELASATRVREAEPGVLEVKGFSIEAAVVNTHQQEAVLPLAEVEVERP